MASPLKYWKRYWPPMIKIFVFDTNSLISASLSPGSVNRKAFDLAREIGIPVYSNATLTEFTETFLRPKFDKYISAEKRLQNIAFLKREASSLRCPLKLMFAATQKIINSLN